MEEPSVLDYLKSKLMPWKHTQVVVPPLAVEPANPPVAAASPEDIPETGPGPQKPAPQRPAALALPWTVIAALALALAAQISLEPRPERSWLPGVILYLLAFAAAGLAIHRSAWKLPLKSPALLTEIPTGENRPIHMLYLLAGASLALLAFLTSSGNRFTLVNSTLLVLAAALILRAFWAMPAAQTSRPRQTILAKFHSLLRPEWRFTFQTRFLAPLALVGWVLFFRFYRLAQTPAEMNSDHAEKLLDILRLLQGQTLIFFPNNGGREGLEMYVAAALQRWFGIPLGFTLLKLVSSLAGFAALIFLYYLGKEIANRRVGWIAFAFAGVAYWPNVVARFGLRLPFYMLFSAATLFFLVRGLKQQRRNDLLLTGLLLGASFYGYTADRILPILVLVILVLYWLSLRFSPRPAQAGPELHRQQQELLRASAGLVLLALVLFLPMLRYMTEAPDAFLFRSLSRLGSLERPLPGPAWLIFLSNLGRALVMFSWDNGEVWTLSIPHRPALDAIAGGLYWIGLFLLGAQWWRKLRRRAPAWIELSLLCSIPILMLPSILSLAFPAENPNLYRTGGVMVPVFLIIALSLDSLARKISRIPSTSPGRGRKFFAWGLIGLLLALSSLHSYSLVFQQYDAHYRLSSWNSSEMGQIIRSFDQLTGQQPAAAPAHAWVVAYPYWVDTRLVGMATGRVDANPVILPADLATTAADGAAKLFLLKPEDHESLLTLQSLYPQGSLSLYPSRTASKEFYIFLAPPFQP